MSGIRVLVVDDQAMMRHAFILFLSSESDIEVVGEAADGQAALTQARALRPDVVLMDVRMPRMNGIDATEAVLNLDPAPRVLITTTFGADDYLLPALRAGAAGFLVKDAEPEQLISAVRSVHRGDSVVSPSVTAELIAEAVRNPAPRQDSDIAGLLLPRELQVLELLAQGLSNAEIATELVISEGTVKSHLGRIMTKLEVRDRLQVLIRAHEAGLVNMRLRET